MKKMQLSSLFILFFCLFLFTSCENKQESINLDEKEQILKLLKSHGFTEQPFSGAGRISTMGEFSERKKIRTLEDAKNFIKIFESFNGGVSITGEIDSAATISYASLPENYGDYTYKLKKGDVNIFTQYDFYGGDKIRLQKRKTQD